MSRIEGKTLGSAAVAAAALALLLAPAAPAQVAPMAVLGGQVAWSPQVAHGGMVLTVAGNGVWLQRQFGRGETAVFDLVDAAGNALPDGRYGWELSLLPRLKLRPEEMAQARGREDGLTFRGPSAGRVESGTFTIAGGAVVDPGLREPEAVRAVGGTEISGDLMATGAKSFSVVDPEDADRRIYYVALEGPEAGTYFRGRTRTVSGEAAIELPAHFAKVTEAEGLTVQLTPHGGWSHLWVAELTPERLVVREAAGAEVEFSFFVQGVRKGYADFEVERSAAPAGRRPATEEEIDR